MSNAMLIQLPSATKSQYRLLWGILRKFDADLRHYATILGKLVMIEDIRDPVDHTKLRHILQGANIMVWLVIEESEDGQVVCYEGSDDHTRGIKVYERFIDQLHRSRLFSTT